MFNWLKNIGKVTEYTGSSDTFKQAYADFKRILKDAERADDIMKSKNELDLMVAFVSTRGEARLIEECHVLLSHKTKGLL